MSITGALVLLPSRCQVTSVQDVRGFPTILGVQTPNLRTGIGCFATMLPLYVWGGGRRGRLLSVSAPMVTDFCTKVRPRSLRGGWCMHHITLGTYGSRPSEARGWEAWATLDSPPFPNKGEGVGLVCLLLLFLLAMFLFLFVSPTSVLKSVPSAHPYGLLSSEHEVSQWSRLVVVISRS